MSGDKRKDNRGRAGKGEAVVSAIATTIDTPGDDGPVLEGRTPGVPSAPHDDIPPVLSGAPDPGDRRIRRSMFPR